MAGSVDMQERPMTSDERLRLLESRMADTLDRVPVLEARIQHLESRLPSPWPVCNLDGDHCWHEGQVYCCYCGRAREVKDGKAVANHADV
jgi:hypothetical protein